MSLVGAELSARRQAGALFILALGGSIAGVLITSGRSIGPGVHVEVELAQTGALRGDGRVRIAGREVGEVRAMRSLTTDSGERHVLIDAFVASAWAASVRKNSTVFVATPSILGEAYLEIGPARGADGRPADPGAPVSDGDRLRGSDPPEIDRFISHVYANLVTIGLLLKEHRPEIDELLARGDDLLGTLAGLPADRGQLGRIRDQTSRAIDDALAIFHALDDTSAIPRVRALARDLEGAIERARPDLAELGHKADRALARIDGLADLYSPGRRAELDHALHAFRSAIEATDRIAGDVRHLTARVERGAGTVGAFAADREIYDDFHEVHRIIKSQPWTLIVKPRKGQKTIAR